MIDKNRERYYANSSLERYKKAMSLYKRTESEDVKKRARKLIIRTYAAYIKHRNAGK